MDSKLRTLAFPDNRVIGYVHSRTDRYPYSFHGRLKKNGGLLEDTDNPGWRMIGEARGTVSVPAGTVTLLEMIPDEARDLSTLRNLEADALDGLWLGNTYVDDDGLVHLTHLVGIEWLDLQNNGGITDRGIAHLKRLTARRHLGLHWTRVSDVGLLMLQDIETLDYLDIWGCAISSEAIARFQKKHLNCRIRTN